MTPPISDIYRIARKDVNKAYAYAKKLEKAHPFNEEVLKCLGYTLALLIAENRRQNKPYENYYQELQEIREKIPLWGQLAIDRYYLGALNRANIIDNETYDYAKQLFNKNSDNAPTLAETLCYLIQKKMKRGEDTSDYEQELQSTLPYFQNSGSKAAISLREKIKTIFDRDTPHLEHIFGVAETNIDEGLALFKQFFKDKRGVERESLEEYKIKYAWKIYEKIKSLEPPNTKRDHEHIKHLLWNFLELNIPPRGDPNIKIIRSLLWQAYRLSKLTDNFEFKAVKFLQCCPQTYINHSCKIFFRIPEPSWFFNPHFDSSIKKDETSQGKENKPETMPSLAYCLFKKGGEDALSRNDQADIRFMLGLLGTLTRQEPKNGSASSLRAKCFKAFDAYDPKIFDDRDFNPKYDSRISQKEDSEDFSIAYRMIKAKYKEAEAEEYQNRLQDFLPYLDLLIEKEPKNIWPLHYKAKSLGLLGNIEEARKLALRVLKENRKDSWRWQAFGNVAKGKEAVSAFCKALTLHPPGNLLINIKKGLLHPLIDGQYYAEASIEIRDIIWLYENQDKNVPSEIKNWTKEPWYSPQENKNNSLFYKELAGQATDILCGNLPWRRGVLNAYENQGQVKYEVFVEDGLFALQAGLPQTLINFAWNPSLGIRLKGEILNDRFEVYQIEAWDAGQEFEIAPQYLAIVSGISQNNAYLFVNTDCTVPILLSKFDGSVRIGEVFEVRLAKKMNGKYVAVTFKKSGKTFREDYTCQFSGYLSLHPKGYGFISFAGEEIHVRAELIDALKQEIKAIKLSSHMGPFFKAVSENDIEDQKVQGLALLEKKGFSALTLSVEE